MALHHRTTTMACVALMLLLMLRALLFNVEIQHTMSMRSSSPFTRDLGKLTKDLLQQQQSDRSFAAYASLLSEKAQRVLADASYEPFNKNGLVYMWDLFNPQVSCADMQRVGSIGDGGKWVCGLEWLRNRPTECVVYSYGVSFDSTFEQEMRATAQCQIHAFDPSVGGLARRVEGATFHKHGLSAQSGSSEQFLLVETLYDAMHRLGHDYVDVLKVDVEGAEWKVFESLLQLNGALRFGQLLIELHFASVGQTREFFDGMSRQGYLIFSREINLNPCVLGKNPVAAEYSFIHPQVFFELSRQRLPLPGITPSWHSRINAVIYFLTRKERLEMMKTTLNDLYVYFLLHYHYPVIIFHDDLSEADERFLVSHVPFTLRFYKVNFELPPFIDPKTIRARTACSPLSSTLGYRHMIRFHAKLVHEILPDEFEYALRLDDDSAITSEVGYDIFRLMKENNKTYGYINTMQDDPTCVTELWNFTRAFMMSKGLNGTFFNSLPEGLIVYNNFEVSHVSIWKTRLYQSFIQAVDENGGIYTHRWGDAPLHTIGISMIVPKEQLHVFTDLAYRHLPFVNQTASGLPKPSTDPLMHENCEYWYNEWRCIHSASNKSNNSLSAPRWGASTSVSRSINAQIRGVIFTFTQHGRITLLTRMLLSLYEQFNDYWQYPVVVYHSDLDETDELQLVRDVNRTGTLQLRKIEILDERQKAIVSEVNPPLFHPCGNSSIHQRAVMRFLAFEAPRLLSAEFDWMWRLGDNIQLKSKVPYDIFVKIAAEGKRYGYLTLDQEHPMCIENLWATANALVGTQRVSSARFEQWPHGLVFLTHFEVSHRSIWESLAYQQLEQLVESNGGIYTHRWGDAPLHTLGVLFESSQTEVHRFDDILVGMELHTITGTDHALPAEPPMRFHDRPVRQKSRADLNSIFAPRRFGWMGGDIAAAVAMPTATEVALCDGEDAWRCVRNFLWLFGDSFFGISDGRRRLESQLVPNAVAVAKLSKGQPNVTIDSIEFFARTENGQAAPIFSVHAPHDAPKQVLWPLAGISVLDTNSNMNTLLVIAQHVAPKDPTKEALFSVAPALMFDVLSTKIVVVSDPRAAPNMWDYTSATFPLTVDGRFRWLAIAAESGRPWAVLEKDEYVFLIGLYDASISRATLFSFLNSRFLQVLGRMRLEDAFAGDVSRVEVLVYNTSQSAHQQPSKHWAITQPGEDLQPVAMGNVAYTEVSVHFDTRRDVWVIVGLQFLHNRVGVCVAEHVLTNIWDCSDVATPEPEWSDARQYMLYAAKAHPELSASEDELVLAFIPNTVQGINALMEEKHYSAYAPKFVSVFTQ